MRYTTRVFRYLNDCNVVEVCLVKSSEVTTTVSGRKKESSNEVVQANLVAVEDAWHLGFSCDFLFCVIFHRILLVILYQTN